MAFRFRRSIRIAPGIRLNLGKRGVSVSVGRRGASVTLGQSGVHGNVGLPGTGLSYRTRLDKTPAHRRRAAREQSRRNRQARPRTERQILAEAQREHREEALSRIEAVLDPKGNVTLKDKFGQRITGRDKSRVWGRQGDELRAWLQTQIQQINGDMDLLLDIHEDTPRPDTSPPGYEPEPYPEAKPIAPDPLPNLPAAPPRPAKPIFRFWHYLLPGYIPWRRRRYRLAAQQWREALRAWETETQIISFEHREDLAAYERALNAWMAGRGAHEREQKRLAADFQEKLQTDSEFMSAILSAELEQLDWPRETLVDLDIDLGREAVDLDVDLPEIEELPQRTAVMSSTGRRLLIRNKSQRQLRSEYARHVHGVILRLIGVVFATLPGIRQTNVSGYSQRLNRGTGHVNDEYLLSVGATRTVFSEMNFDRLDQVDPIVAVERFDLRRNMTKTGIFKPVRVGGRMRSSDRHTSIT